VEHREDDGRLVGVAGCRFEQRHDVLVVERHPLAARSPRSFDPLGGVVGDELQQQAAADGRSVASYTAWLLAQDLERPSQRRRASATANPRDRRVRLRIGLVLPLGMRNRLRRKAAQEMRSVSGLVGRVVVEVLAAK
jgi:hypothetical protein